MTDLAQAFLYQPFEQYAPGTPLEEVPGFDACSNGRIVSEADGRRVMETHVKKGDQGWSRWGYVHEQVPKLKKGDKLWYRVGMFFPADFSFQTDHGSLKTFRFGRRTIDGKKNRGCIDLQITSSGSWRVGVEYDWKAWDGTRDFWVPLPSSANVKKGQWQLFEAHVVFDDKSVADGGLGQIRFWADGNPAGVIDDRPTLSGPGLGSPASEFWRVLMFTYWNGDAPKTQSMRMDHATLFVEGAGHHGERHLSRDSTDYPYIGTTMAGVVDPKPPPSGGVSWSGTPEPPLATVGEPYYYAFGHLIHGPRPLDCVLAAGELADGLSIDSDDEAIVGTPLEGGRFDGLRIAAETRP